MCHATRTPERAFGQYQPVSLARRIDDFPAGTPGFVVLAGPDACKVWLLVADRADPTRWAHVDVRSACDLVAREIVPVEGRPFRRFDVVRTRHDIDTHPAGTCGAIIEVLGRGSAFRVELPVREGEDDDLPLVDAQPQELEWLGVGLMDRPDGSHGG